MSFYCPFHSNTHSPSCSINLESGAWICFNPACSESGTLLDLVKRTLQKNDFQALRYISGYESEKVDEFDEALKDILEDKPDFVEFPQDLLDRLHADLAGSNQARAYLESRSITIDSMKHFKLGYSNALGMVITPVHAPDGTPVGMVGRSIEGKSFKNSTNLPKNKTLFNIHRAKRIGNHVIIVESNFDAIRVHQAGFPNVVATLGGHVSQDHIKLLNRYFNKITIMTDADQAGRELGKEIISRLRGKEIMWAAYDYKVLYPHEAKDVGDMTDAEITQCIKNAVPDIEYRSWI